MSVLLAVAFGLLIGLSLGALGGGGSILTVPVLVYAIGQSAQDATTGSLVIVGITSAVAAAGHARSGRVRWGAGVAIGAAGVLASLAGTRLNARVSPTALLVSFAVLMVVAATAMLAKTMVPARPSELVEDQQAARLRLPARAGGGARQPGQGRGELGASRFVRLARVAAAAHSRHRAQGGRRRARRRLPHRLPRRRRRLRHRARAGAVAALRHADRRRHVPARDQPQQRGGAARPGRPRDLHLVGHRPVHPRRDRRLHRGKRVADKVSGASLTRAFAVLLLAVAAYVMLKALFA